MKYILPLVISLFFTACNDSDQKTNVTSETNKTQKEQIATPIQTIATQTPVEVNSSEINGETIFNKCKSCHGNNAERKALGASQVIQGWDEAKIENALKGYQSGTYGGGMKNIMAAQAKTLSEEDIKKVATYIHTL